MSSWKGWTLRIEFTNCMYKLSRLHITSLGRAHCIYKFILLCTKWTCASLIIDCKLCFRLIMLLTKCHHVSDKMAEAKWNNFNNFFTSPSPFAERINKALSLRDVNVRFALDLLISSWKYAFRNLKRYLLFSYLFSTF